MNVGFSPLLSSQLGVGHAPVPDWLIRGAPDRFAVLQADYDTGHYWHRGVRDLPGFKLSAADVYTRTTTKSYLNSAAVLSTAAINAEAFDFTPAGAALGLSLDGVRTNVLLNSSALITQNCVVTVQAYTLSFWGTGSVALSGAYTGTLVGTGAGNRVTLTFTPAAGTLTLTPSGTVMNAQLEAGAFVTPYIPTTSATVTRAQDFQTFGPAPYGPELVYPNAWILGGYSGGFATNSPPGTLSLVSPADGGAYADQPLATEIGQIYYYTANRVGAATTTSFGTTQGASDVATASGSPAILTTTFIATSTTTWIRLARLLTTAGGATNISVRKAEVFPGFVPGQGALVWEGSVSQTSLTCVLFSLDANSNANRFYATVDAGGSVSLGVFANGVSQGGIVSASGIVSPNSLFRLMALWQNNRLELWVNDVLVGLDTTLTIPPMFNLKLGRRYDGLGPMFGHVAKVAYFDIPPWDRAAALSVVGAV